MVLLRGQDKTELFLKKYGVLTEESDIQNDKDCQMLQTIQQSHCEPNWPSLEAKELPIPLMQNSDEATAEAKNRVRSRSRSKCKYTSQKYTNEWLENLCCNLYVSGNEEGGLAPGFLSRAATGKEQSEEFEEYFGGFKTGADNHQSRKNKDEYPKKKPRAKQRHLSTYNKSECRVHFQESKGEPVAPSTSKDCLNSSSINTIFLRTHGANETEDYNTSTCLPDTTIKPKRTQNEVRKLSKVSPKMTKDEATEDPKCKKGCSDKCCKIKIRQRVAGIRKDRKGKSPIKSVPKPDICSNTEDQTRSYKVFKPPSGERVPSKSDKLGYSKGDNLLVHSIEKGLLTPSVQALIRRDVEKCIHEEMQKAKASLKKESSKIRKYFHASKIKDKNRLGTTDKKRIPNASPESDAYQDSTSEDILSQCRKCLQEAKIQSKQIKETFSRSNIRNGTARDNSSTNEYLSESECFRAEYQIPAAKTATESMYNEYISDKGTDTVEEIKDNDGRPNEPNRKVSTEEQESSLDASVAFVDKTKTRQEPGTSYFSSYKNHQGSNKTELCVKEKKRIKSEERNLNEREKCPSPQTELRVTISPNASEMNNSSISPSKIVFSEESVVNQDDLGVSQRQLTALENLADFMTPGETKTLVKAVLAVLDRRITAINKTKDCHVEHVHQSSPKTSTSYTSRTAQVGSPVEHFTTYQSRVFYNEQYLTKKTSERNSSFDANSEQRKKLLPQKEDTDMTEIVKKKYKAWTRPDMNNLNGTEIFVDTGHIRTSEYNRSNASEQCQDTSQCSDYKPNKVSVKNKKSPGSGQKVSHDQYEQDSYNKRCESLTQKTGFKDVNPVTVHDEDGSNYALLKRDTPIKNWPIFMTSNCSVDTASDENCYLFQRPTKEIPHTDENEILSSQKFFDDKKDNLSVRKRHGEQNEPITHPEFQKLKQENDLLQRHHRTQKYPIKDSMIETEASHNQTPVALSSKNSLGACKIVSNLAPCPHENSYRNHHHSKVITPPFADFLLDENKEVNSTRYERPLLVIENLTRHVEALKKQLHYQSLRIKKMDSDSEQSKKKFHLSNNDERSDTIVNEQGLQPEKDLDVSPQRKSRPATICSKTGDTNDTNQAVGIMIQKRESKLNKESQTLKKSETSPHKRKQTDQKRISREGGKIILRKEGDGFCIRKQPHKCITDEKVEISKPLSQKKFSQKVTTNEDTYSDPSQSEELNFDNLTYDDGSTSGTSFTRRLQDLNLSHIDTALKNVSEENDSETTAELNSKHGLVHQKNRKRSPKKTNPHRDEPRVTNSLDPSSGLTTPLHIKVNSENKSQHIKKTNREINSTTNENKSKVRSPARLVRKTKESAIKTKYQLNSTLNKFNKKTNSRKSSDMGSNKGQKTKDAEVTIRLLENFSPIKSADIATEYKLKTNAPNTSDREHDTDLESKGNRAAAGAVKNETKKNEIASELARSSLSSFESSIFDFIQRRTQNLRNSAFLDLQNHSSMARSERTPDPENIKGHKIVRHDAWETLKTEGVDAESFGKLSEGEDDVNIEFPPGTFIIKTYSPSSPVPVNVQAHISRSVSFAHTSFSSLRNSEIHDIATQNILPL